jgi:tetratricopeptide (TPR) repeat protein
MFSMGNVHLQRGQLEQARDCYTRSLGPFRELGNAYQEAAALTNLGAAAVNQGRFDEAKDLIANALYIKKELGDRQGVANALAFSPTLTFTKESMRMRWQSMGRF